MFYFLKQMIISTSTKSEFFGGGATKLTLFYQIQFIIKSLSIATCYINFLCKNKGDIVWDNNNINVYKQYNIGIYLLIYSILLFAGTHTIYITNWS